MALRIAGSSTDGSKTLAQYGVATIFMPVADYWTISGLELSRDRDFFADGGEGCSRHHCRRRAIVGRLETAPICWPTARRTITATPDRRNRPHTYWVSEESGDFFTTWHRSPFVTVTATRLSKCVTDSLGASGYTNNVRSVGADGLAICIQYRLAIGGGLGRMGTETLRAEIPERHADLAKTLP